MPAGNSRMSASGYKQTYRGQLANVRFTPNSGHSDAQELLPARSAPRPTRELRGDKQKDPPSAFAPGPVGGRVHALPCRSVRDGAARASRSRLIRSGQPVAYVTKAKPGAAMR